MIPTTSVSYVWCRIVGGNRWQLRGRPNAINPMFGAWVDNTSPSGKFGWSCRWFTHVYSTVYQSTKKSWHSAPTHDCLACQLAPHLKVPRGSPADGKLSRAALSSLHHISAEEVWNNNRGFMSNLRTTKTTCSRIVCNPPQFMANESHPPRFTQTSTIPLRGEKIIKVWAFPLKKMETIRFSTLDPLYPWNYQAMQTMQVPIGTNSSNFQRVRC